MGPPKAKRASPNPPVIVTNSSKSKVKQKAQLSPSPAPLARPSGDGDATSDEDEDEEEEEDEDEDENEDGDGDVAAAAPITRASLGDSYLLSHLASATSANLLSSSLSSHFTPASLLASLPLPASAKIGPIDYKKYCTMWSYELAQNYTVLVHGFGSKRSHLNRFSTYVRDQLSPHGVIIIAGYHHPPLASILEAISSLLPTSSPSLPSITKSLSTLKAPIYLVVHSLSLLPPTTLSALFTLSSFSDLHLLASIDHIRSDFLLPSTSKSFNPVFHAISTLEPYTTEVLAAGTLARLLPPEIFFDPQASANGKKGGSFAKGISVESALQVFKTVTKRSRDLFSLLSQLQLSLSTAIVGASSSKTSPSKSSPAKRAYLPPELSAVSYVKLKARAVDDLIALSETQVEALLSEWRDHAVVKSSPDRPGEHADEEDGDEEEEDGSEGWVWIDLVSEGIEEVMRRSVADEDEEDAD